MNFGPWSRANRQKTALSSSIKETTQSLQGLGLLALRPQVTASTQILPLERGRVDPQCCFQSGRLRGLRGSPCPSDRRDRTGYIERPIVGTDARLSDGNLQPTSRSGPQTSQFSDTDLGETVSEVVVLKLDTDVMIRALRFQRTVDWGSDLSILLAQRRRVPRLTTFTPDVEENYTDKRGFFPMTPTAG